jgi:hypothetical protein
VWQKLEQQNPEFFKAYNIRIKIKDQINIFNELVNDQAQMMKQEGVLVQNNATPTTPTTNAPPNIPSTKSNVYGRQSTTPSPSQSPVFDNRRGSTTVNSNINNGPPTGNLLNTSINTREGMLSGVPNAQMHGPSFMPKSSQGKHDGKDHQQIINSLLQEKNANRQQQQMQELQNLQSHLITTLHNGSGTPTQQSQQPPSQPPRRGDSMSDNQDLLQQHQMLMQQIHQLQQQSSTQSDQQNTQSSQQQQQQQQQQQSQPQHQQPLTPIQTNQFTQQLPQIMPSPSNYLNTSTNMNSPQYLRTNSESAGLESAGSEFYEDLGISSEVGALFGDQLEDYNTYGHQDITHFFLDDDNNK